MDGLVRLNPGNSNITLWEQPVKVSARLSSNDWNIAIYLTTNSCPEEERVSRQFIGGHVSNIPNHNPTLLTLSSFEKIIPYLKYDSINVDII